MSSSTRYCAESQSLYTHRVLKKILLSNTSRENILSGSCDPTEGVNEWSYNDPTGRRRPYFENDQTFYFVFVHVERERNYTFRKVSGANQNVSSIIIFPYQNQVSKNQMYEKYYCILIINAVLDMWLHPWCFCSTILFDQ